MNTVIQRAVLLCAATLLVSACPDEQPASAKPAVDPQTATPEAGAPAEPTGDAVPAEKPAAQAAEAGAGPVHGTLLIATAQFEEFETPAGQKGSKPGPAKLVLLTQVGEQWQARTLEDPESIVFHKALCWPLKGPTEGVLTIGANEALARTWRREGGAWRSETLWHPTFGGKWNRLRDIEVGDLDGDGNPELAIATHDQGVVAILDGAAGAWEAKEIHRQDDTFIHEAEIGDVDGDGRPELYVTPSNPNKVGVSQPGGILAFRYDREKKAYVKETVVELEGSHAKEILVADVDGDGRDELYASVEATLEVKDGQLSVSQPVEVRLFERSKAGRWTSRTLAELEGGLQSRVLLMADLTGSGRELVVTTMRSGVWRLVPPKKQGGQWRKVQIDAAPRGFENAAAAADLDGDGTPELYVTPEDLDEVRRYEWNGSDFDQSVIHRLDRRDIPWNIVACKGWAPGEAEPAARPAVPAAGE